MIGLKEKIFSIGEDMVKCLENCKGICNNPQLGILPRCLYFENKGNDSIDGSVIVGINPGQGSEIERSFYSENKNTYQSQVVLWEKEKRANYYNFLEDFNRCLGRKGPVLWTELVKCQSLIAGQDIPLQTFRNCTYKYLNKELEIIPEGWPLLAIGREAHKALCYLYPQRTVIGVPHPTSSRGQFASLFENSNRKKFIPEVQTQIDYILNNPGKEQWLFNRKSK